MFIGAKFCSHCGAPAARAEVPTNVLRLCPRCRLKTNAILIGKTNLRECPKCEGLWADAESFQRICTDREQQAAVLGVAGPIEISPNRPLEQVRYIPCPVCKQLMHRVNFANCSTVIVDVCRKHGTWLDKDELRRIVEFIQAGGFDKARALQISELERERKRLELEKWTRAPDAVTGSGYYRGSSRYDVRELALESVAAAMVGALFDV